MKIKYTLILLVLSLCGAAMLNALIGYRSAD